MDATESRHELRVLVLAPTGRDAALAHEVLSGAGITAVTCPTMHALCAELPHGAGALVIAEEALTPESTGCLADAIRTEPRWSDLPVIVLLGVAAAPRARQALHRLLEPIRNVTVIERPMGIAGFVSAIQAALRARERQYEIRDLMGNLQRALRARDEFMAAISHELRTPLNVILGRTAVLRRPPYDAERIASGLDSIERNTRILWQLVEDLIDVARMESGAFRIRMEPVDLVAVVRAAVDSLHSAAEARRLTLTCAGEEHALFVRGDEVRLQQVIWNLVWNAVKFTPAGGRIDVLVRTRGREHEIDVRDTGVGIAPDLLPHIFEPFKQGADAATDRHRGLGLGLAIVRHLVELHGGTVAGESAGVGRGACFTIRLPASDEAGPGTSGGEEQAPPRESTAQSS